MPVMLPKTLTQYAIIKYRSIRLDVNIGGGTFPVSETRPLPYVLYVGYTEHISACPGGLLIPGKHYTIHRLAPGQESCIQSATCIVEATAKSRQAQHARRVM